MKALPQTINPSPQILRALAPFFIPIHTETHHQFCDDLLTQAMLILYRPSLQLRMQLLWNPPNRQAFHYGKVPSLYSHLNSKYSSLGPPLSYPAC